MDAGLFGRGMGVRDQWQSVWELYSKVRLGCAWLSGAGRCADAESPVRKETARRSRVMIGAWGEIVRQI